MYPIVLDRFEHDLGFGHEGHDLDSSLLRFRLSWRIMALNGSISPPGTRYRSAGEFYSSDLPSTIEPQHEARLVALEFEKFQHRQDRVIRRGIAAAVL